MLAWLRNKVAVIAGVIAGVALFLTNLSEIRNVGEDMFCTVVRGPPWAGMCIEPESDWKDRRENIEYLAKKNKEGKLTPTQEEIYLKLEIDFIKDTIVLLEKQRIPERSDYRIQFKPITESGSD